jgi:hypothetical protein
MKDLIEALTILAKYMDDTRNPTNCDHDLLYVNFGKDKSVVSEEDMKRLDELNFWWDYNLEGFSSYRFGSC